MSVGATNFGGFPALTSLTGGGSMATPISSSAESGGQFDQQTGAVTLGDFIVGGSSKSDSWFQYALLGAGALVAIVYFKRGKKK